MSGGFQHTLCTSVKVGCNCIRSNPFSWWVSFPCQRLGFRLGCSFSKCCRFLLSHSDMGGRVWSYISSIQCVQRWFTSKWVYVVGTTGGGENSHLSSLRNAWGDWRGVTGRVSSPSSKGSSDISGEGSTGRKGSLSLKLSILLISLSSSDKSCEQSILQTFHYC